MKAMSESTGHTVSDWWSEIDAEVLALLQDGRPASPADLGRRLGLSEAAVSSLLWGLASEGKIRIRQVERACS
jgi:DNA-binding Lrp family transcriptional regulator